MSIHFSEKEKLFTIQTKNSTYQMKVDKLDYLLHLYYGSTLADGNMDYLLPSADVGFSGNPWDLQDDRTFSLDFLPQEFSSCGVGDYRINSINLTEENGCNVFDGRYVSHKIIDGVKNISGMPYIYDNNDNPKTLEITLKDNNTDLEVILNYTVFYEMDIIARSTTFKNNSKNDIRLNKIMSASVDFCDKDLNLLHFYGRHAMERITEKTSIPHGITSFSSKRGTSSHHHNPSIILCEDDTTEFFGNCYGFTLVYSGNFLIEIEKDQFSQIRTNIGINPENFEYIIEKGQSFETPQVLMTYSKNGLSQLSQNFHKAIRNNICRGKYKLERRPVLINNWEATYFDFNDDKIVNIAKQASALGIEMFVLDDGWFGKRDDDNSGLGDWFVNNNKLKNGLPSLVEEINKMGMKFGLWFEPEMISYDSDLYRKNPDWAIKVPNRNPNKSRNQLVLDMSRQDVRDYLFERMTSILDSCNIEYVKWDMNRSICDAYSALLPKERQGEFYHRYILGLYDLLEKITSRYPNLLLEGCSGGGGRFDVAMMYYSPQFWCSDNTDAIERLQIQYGTSFIYPISTVGSHVSAVPNHQTGRTTTIDTRAVVAMSGSFGYEMDLNLITDEEKEKVKEQINTYKKLQPIIHNGLYYRLSSPITDSYTAWQFVSTDLKETLVNIVVTKVFANKPHLVVKLKGLDENKKYIVEGEDKIYTGSMLMNGGIKLKNPNGNYPSYQLYIKQI